MKKIKSVSVVLIVNALIGLLAGFSTLIISFNKINVNINCSMGSGCGNVDGVQIKKP